ncbi:hypothetical protein HKX48_005311 [Thoreauomyces humboldtii]|nr:hypothetical protein HKX48_005311 [Thoreauomyces humboldtii]
MGKSNKKDESPYEFVPHTQYMFTPLRPGGAEESDRQLTLKIKQQPERARAYGGGPNEKGDRRPLDPPPIAQLLLTSKRTGKQCADLLHNPYYMCYASLWHEDRDEEIVAAEDAGRGSALLMGTLVTSMARLKDVNNVDGAYFPFVNLVVMIEGTFRIMFTVFEIGGGMVHCRAKACTAPFVSYGKAFPGVTESTALCRVFADQGVRLRVRKEPKLRRSKPTKQKAQGEKEAIIKKVSLKRRRSGPTRPTTVPMRKRSASGGMTGDDSSAKPAQYPPALNTGIAQQATEFRIAIPSAKKPSRHPEGPISPFSAGPTSSEPCSALWSARQPSPRATFRSPSSVSLRNGAEAATHVAFFGNSSPSPAYLSNPDHASLSFREERREFGNLAQAPGAARHTPTARISIDSLMSEDYHAKPMRYLSAAAAATHTTLSHPAAHILPVH